MFDVIFENIAQFSYGSMPDKSLIKNENPYQIWSGYIYSGYYPKKNVDKGDLIIIARGVGGTGDVKIAKKDAWLTNLSIKVKIINNTILPQYLYYKFSYKNLRYLDSGSAQSQITINDLKKLKFQVHTLPEQLLIVDIIEYLVFLLLSLLTLDFLLIFLLIH